MANVLSTLFQDIANAIRSKNGDTDKMKPIDFPKRFSRSRAVAVAVAQVI